MFPVPVSDSQIAQPPHRYVSNENAAIASTSHISMVGNSGMLSMLGMNRSFQRCFTVDCKVWYSTTATSIVACTKRLTINVHTISDTDGKAW